MRLVRVSDFQGKPSFFSGLTYKLFQLAIGGLALVLLAIASPAEAQWAEIGNGKDKPYALKGAETCLKCHDKGGPVTMLHTAHAVKGDPSTPFAQHFCESCHGASPEHLAKPKDGEKRAPPAVVFGKNSANTAEEKNKVCSGCHEGGKLMNWSGSQHQASNTACVDCHSMHTTKDPATTRQDMPSMCFNCHQEQRAQTLRPSHHPIREGVTVCSDCHNVHGSPTQKLLVGRTVNDTCYNCHAEMRGPFLWEHAPVREDCTICHSPHGTTQAGLLKQRVPYLCQDCHSVVPAGHSAQFLTNTTSTTHEARVKGRACLNCHSQIHGSNHPSGPRLMR